MCSVGPRMVGLPRSSVRCGWWNPNPTGITPSCSINWVWASGGLTNRGRPNTLHRGPRRQKGAGRAAAPGPRPAAARLFGVADRTARAHRHSGDRSGGRTVRVRRSAASAMPLGSACVVAARAGHPVCRGSPRRSNASGREFVVVGDGLRLVEVLGVGLVYRRRHDVVLATGYEQRRQATARDATRHTRRGLRRHCQQLHRLEPRW